MVDVEKDTLIELDTMEFVKGSIFEESSGLITNFILSGACLLYLIMFALYWWCAIEWCVIYYLSWFIKNEFEFSLSLSLISSISKDQHPQIFSKELKSKFRFSIDLICQK
jgi:hypothetical protein